MDSPYGAAALPSPERLARATGLLYLVLVVFGMFAPIVLETLVVPGDAAATVGNVLGAPGLFGSSLVAWVVIVVADVAIAATLYLLLAPAGRTLSLVAAALRLLYAAVLGAFLLHLFDAFALLTHAPRAAGLDAAQVQATAAASLDTFGAGFRLALVFFGAHLLPLGFLLYRSRYVPRVLGLLLMAAGAGYIADSLAGFFVAGHGDVASGILLAPALLGELGLTAWLLVKGVRGPGPGAAWMR